MPLTAASHRERYVHLAMIVALAGLLYANALTNGYSVDDLQFVVNNRAVHGFSWQNLVALFTSVPNRMEYLPVKDLTYCLDVTLFGVQPFGLHLMNVVWYMLASSALYLFLRRLLTWLGQDSPRLALVATVLFVAHPLHVASVASICQRKDLVSGFLLFIALDRYLHYRLEGGTPRYLLSLFLFALTLLSKATVMTVPLFLLALEWFAPQERRRDSGRQMLLLVPFFVLVALFIKVESGFLQQTGVLSQLFSSTVAPSIRVATAVKAIFYYLKMMLFPYPLLMIHDFGFAKQVISPVTIAAGAGTALLFGVALWLRRLAPLAGIAIIWLLVTLLPVSGLIPSNTLIAERYLFLPLAGFTLLVASGWRWMYERDSLTMRRFGFVLLVFLLAVYGGLTVKRNPDWHDNLTLLLANARDLPGKPGVYYQVGAEYFAQGNVGAALEFLAKAKDLNDFYGIHYAVYAAITAYEAGNLEQAKAVLDEIRHPFKLQVVEVNYLYGKICQSAGDLVNAGIYYRNADRSSLPLGLIKPPDIAAALASLASPVPQR